MSTDSLRVAGAYRPSIPVLQYHTGLLNMSLLHAAATPVGTGVIFSRHAGTPLTVNGSGTGPAVVPVSPLISTSNAAGGLITRKRR